MARRLIVLVIVLLPFLWGCAGSSTNPHNYELSVEQASEAYSVYKKGDYPEAVRQYEFLTSKVPDDANFWFYLGNSYLKNKQPRQAEMAYENAIIRDVKLSKAWYNLGLLHMQEALKVFIDMQTHLSQDDPIRKAGEKKMDHLLEVMK